MAKKINLWLDNWLGSSLVSVFNINPAAWKSLCFTLFSVLDAGRWRLPPPLLSNSVVVASILNITLPVTPLLDKVVWIHTTDGDLSAKQVFLFLRGTSNLVDWATLIWRPCIPPSHSFIFWRLMHKKVPTDEHLQSRGCTIVSICVLCFRAAETSDHIFFSCDYAVRLWCWLGALLHCSFPLQSLEALLSCVPATCTSQLRDVFVSAIVHALHKIWLARNEIRFGSHIITLSMGTGYCIPTDTTV